VLAEEFSEANEFILITDGVAKLISTPPPPKQAQFGSWGSNGDMSASSGNSGRPSGLKRYSSFLAQKTTKSPSHWVAEPVVIGSLEAWEYFGERSLVYKGELRKVR
jgi:hypothetical protein